VLDGEGFGIAGVVAQEEGERGAGFDGSDDAVGGGFAEEVEALLFVAADAGDAYHHTDEAGKAGDGELLDAHGHLGIGVVGVDLEGGFAVAARGIALAGGGDVAVVDEGDEGGVHASGKASGEVGVGVVGVLFDLPIAESDGGVGEGFDAVSGGLRNGDATLGGEEAVVRVVGGVEEILTVELAEDERHEDVSGGDGALGVGALDGFEAGERALVVEVVEVLVGVAERRSEVDGVGVGGGIERLRVDWRPEQEGKEESRDYVCAVFYRCSPVRSMCLARSISTSRCGSTVKRVRLRIGRTPP